MKTEIELIKEIALLWVSNGYDDDDLAKDWDAIMNTVRGLGELDKQIINELKHE